MSFTTVNLPNIAIVSNKDVEKFFKILDERLLIVKKQLLLRFETQCKLKVKDFPFLMGQNLYLDSDKLKPNDSIREAIKHGTLSIGFVGLAETLKSLTGFHHGESKESLNLGEKIIAYMRKRCDEFTQEEHLNFTLLASPKIYWAVI